jgi:hypothetical protein
MNLITERAWTLKQTQKSCSWCLQFPASIFFLREKVPLPVVSLDFSWLSAPWSGLSVGRKMGPKHVPRGRPLDSSATWRELPSVSLSHMWESSNISRYLEELHKMVHCLARLLYTIFHKMVPSLRYEEHWVVDVDYWQLKGAVYALVIKLCTVCTPRQVKKPATVRRGLLRLAAGT